MEQGIVTDTSTGYPVDSRLPHATGFRMNDQTRTRLDDLRTWTRKPKWAILADLIEREWQRLRGQGTRHNVDE